jgi:hypothetical protein
MQHQGVSTAVPAESGGEETSPNHSNPDKDRAVVLEKASISNVNFTIAISYHTEHKQGFKCNDFVNRSFYGPEELKENFFKVFQGASRLEDPSIPPMPSIEKSSTVKARSKNVITFPRVVPDV